jgi:subtilase family serine protease
MLKLANLRWRTGLPCALRRREILELFGKSHTQNGSNMNSPFPPSNRVTSRFSFLPAMSQGAMSHGMLSGLLPSLLPAILAFSFALSLALTIPAAQAQAPSAAVASAAAGTVTPAALPGPRARVTQAVDEKQLFRLQGNVNPMARAKFDQGAVDDAMPATRALVLLQRSQEQEAALAQLLEDQQNKASANYHAWLTPEQFGAQFGPADSDVQAVTQWLTTHGFQNIKVAPGKTAIEFSGNVGQMREAFHTDIHRFMVRGQARNANVSDPQIPAALAPVVRGVVGLTNFRPRAHLHQLGTFRKTKATGQIKPLFSFSPNGGCPPLPSCVAVGPGDFAKIYSVPAMVNGQPAGQGVTIAVVGDSNINPEDFTDYRTLFGLPLSVSGFATTSPLVVMINGPDPGINGDEIEADLDTQVSGAVAPNAQILLVVTEQPDSGVGAAGVDLSVLYVINNNLAPVVSKSFGECEAFEGNAGNALQNALWQQAAAQGITGMVSAGDNGSAACDPASNDLDVAVFGQAVSGDASTPFNTAVGGTDFNQNAGNFSTFWNTTSGTLTSALGYIPEMTWNESCAKGGVNACTTAIIEQHSAGLQSAGPDLVAGAGGVSSCINSTQDAAGNINCLNGYAKPSWQFGLGVPQDQSRDIPDVSLFASNGVTGSFYIICNQDSNQGSGSSTTSCDLNSPFLDFQGVGGTSASSPAFAGIMALVNQQTGQRQGNANPVLYLLAAGPNATCTSAASPANTCIFYDIPPGSNNSVACQGQTFGCSNQTDASTFGILIDVQVDGVTPTTPITPSFSTTANYDLATGLGSVNVTNLLKNWASVTLRPTTTTFVLNGGSPVNIAHGTAVTVSGTVMPNSAAAVGPSGFVELIDGATTPGIVIDTFTVQANGTYSGSTTSLPGSTTPYTVVAHYGGDTTYGASSAAAVTVTAVSKEPSKVSVNLVTFDPNTNNPIVSNAAASLPYGSSYILQVAVTNVSAAAGTVCTPPPFSPSVPCPTGPVQLFDALNGAAKAPLPDFLVPNTKTQTNTANLNNSGFAEDQPIQLNAGAHTITATYAGDASFNANTASNTLALTITQAQTQTTISVPTGTITVGTMVTLTATVVGPNSNGAAPTGMVQFKNGSAALMSPVTCGSPVGFNPNTGAPPSCTATITTALSFLPPQPTPWQMPRFRIGPMWLASFLLLMALLILFLLTLGRVAPRHRAVYACAGVLLFVCAAAGIAGCGSGGGGGGGGGGGHVDSITAVYTGDTNYSSSTSPAVGISVQ